MLDAKTWSGRSRAFGPKALRDVFRPQWPCLCTLGYFPSTWGRERESNPMFLDYETSV